jgi:hypothetical protein
VSDRDAQTRFLIASMTEYNIPHDSTRVLPGCCEGHDRFAWKLINSHIFPKADHNLAVIIANNAILDHKP